jgi:hypothetical protein
MATVDDTAARRALSLLAERVVEMRGDARGLCDEATSVDWWRKTRMVLADSLLEPLDDETRLAVEAAMEAAVAQEFQATGL